MEKQDYSKKEKISSIFLVYLLMFISVSYFANLLLQEALNIHISVSALLYGLAVVIGMSSYIYFGRKTKVLTFVFSVILIAGTVLFLLIHSDYSYLVFSSFLDLAYNPTIILFAYCIPVLIISTSGFVKYDYVLNIAIHVSRIVLIVFAICFFVFQVGSSVWAGQYMTTTYNAMPAICISIISFTRKGKWYLLDGCLSVICIFITLIGGSRGAFVCDILFIILIVLISPNAKKNTKILVVLGSILAIVLILLLSDKLLLIIESFVSARGFNSRTLSRITSNSFFQSNDRILLWKQVIDATWKSPVFGYGVWGDRPIILGYTHNLFLELFCSYGFIIGGIFSIWLIANTAKYVIFRKHDQSPEYLFFLLSIPYGLFQLMFSDSYLFNVWFFAILGMIICNNMRTVKNEGLSSL